MNLIFCIVVPADLFFSIIGTILSYVTIYNGLSSSRSTSQGVGNIDAS